MDDNDKHLTCEATNELIPDVVVRDTWKIGVHCKWKFIIFIFCRDFKDCCFNKGRKPLTFHIDFYKSKKWKKGISLMDIWKAECFLTSPLFCLDTPVVYLSKVGNSSVAKLGEDITLKCIIQSNPTHHTVIWTREVMCFSCLSIVYHIVI